MNANLLSPLKIGDYTLVNRVIMAPLTRMRATMPGNIPNDLNATYYSQRAGAGLIISEAAPISPMAHGYHATPGIHSAEQVAGWKLVTRAVHDVGGKIFCQLWHVGRQSHPDLLPGGTLPVAPSALPVGGQAPTAKGMRDRVIPRALETREISVIVDEYRAAAKNALDAGFDGIEIHAANGYLLEQFLADGANLRTDQYGGSVENRSRLSLEVVDALLPVWGANKIGIRLSPSNTFGNIAHTDRWAQYSHVVSELNKRQLAYIHLVEPRVDGSGDKQAKPDDIELSRLRPLITGNTKIIAAGGHNFDSGNQSINSGVADAVAFGRLFIANPDLPVRFARGAALNPYNRNTFYGGGARGYTDYPFLDQAAA